MRRLLLMTSLFLLLPTVLPAEEAGDPTVDEIVRMLEAGVAEQVVVRWLEGAEPPKAVTPDDIVALEKAGASDELILELIGSASRPESAPKPAPPTPSVPPPPAVDGSRGPEAEAKPTLFLLSFQPDVGEDEGDQEWDLYFYLDGRFLAWLPSTGGVFAGRDVSLERQLEPGPHVLQMLRERHTRKRVNGPWRHRARVAPVAVEFEVEAGEQRQVVVEFVETRFAIGVAPGPISYSVRTDERILTQGVREGTNLGEWPALCEEVEANLEPGEKPSRNQRGELENCRRWDELWPVPVPSRDEVRRKLEAADFRPSPAGLVR